MASLEGKVEIQIRDLDQAVIGNPVHDLIRLALSLATAARSSDLPGVSTALMMEAMIVGYEEALIDPRDQRKPSGQATDPIQFAMKLALKRRWRQLAEDRIEDVTPTIPLGKRFWVLRKGRSGKLLGCSLPSRSRKLITCLRHRDLMIRWRFWMQPIG